MQDFRFAFRRCFRTPGFSLLTIVAMALAIGSITTLFSFVRGVLLRPLPYPDPDRLVMVCETHPERPDDWCGASPANWNDWSRRTTTLETLGLARGWPLSLRSGERSRGVRGGIATPGLFQTFKVRLSAGRAFLPGDILPGNEKVALVSYEFSRDLFGQGRRGLGQDLEIEGAAYRIIGVLPADFVVPELERVQVWIPLWPRRLSARDWRGFRSFARLKPEVGIDAARSEMKAIRNSLAELYPEDNQAWGVVIDGLHERTVRSVRPALIAFMAAAFLVLLTASANVATLFLSRAASRWGEFSLRLALGVRPVRLMRLMLTESLFLSLTAGAFGILIALWMVDGFLAWSPGWVPRLNQVEIDGYVLLLAAVVSVGSGLFFGLVPLLQIRKRNLVSDLRSSRIDTGPRGGRLRDILVVAEIGAACVLLIGSGLLLRSFGNLLDWQPGFDRSNLVVVPLFCSPAKYAEGHQVSDLYDTVVRELATVPNVVSAGAGSAVPLLGGDGEQEFYIEDRPMPPVGSFPTVAWFDVHPDYFATLRLPLVKGRSFNAFDRPDAPLVAIINQTMARRYWPGADPIGREVRMMAHKSTFKIVGIVSDVAPFLPGQAPSPKIYWPFAQVPRWAVMAVVRTAGAPGLAVPQIRSKIESLDPDLDIGAVRTMDDLIEQRLITPRFHGSLAAALGGLAFVIALLGLYGVSSFQVSQRFYEFGIRVAVGASRGDLLRLVMRKSGLLTILGIACGFAGAMIFGRVLGSLLMGVVASDPLTYAGTALVIGVTALVAAYLPARRAAQVDPVSSLRTH